MWQIVVTTVERRRLVHVQIMEHHYVRSVIGPTTFHALLKTNVTLGAYQDQANIILTTIGSGE